MKKIIKIIAVILLFLSFVYFAGRYYLNWQTFPLKYQTKPDYKAMAIERITLKTGEEINIVFSEKQDDVVFVYFHGNAGQIPYILSFLQQNYSFVSPSYAGYGGSSGLPSVQNVLEVAKEVKGFVRRKFPNKEIYAFGHSLGSQALVHYASIEENITSAAVIGGFDSIFEMCKERMANVEFICIIAKNSFNAGKEAIYNFFPFTFISFHHEKDRIVPYTRGIKLYEEINANKKLFITLEDGDHANFDIKFITDEMMEK